MTAEGFGQGWTLIDPKDVDANNTIFEASQTIIHAQDGTIFQTGDGTIAVVVNRIVGESDGSGEAADEMTKCKAHEVILRVDDDGGLVRVEDEVVTAEEDHVARVEVKQEGERKSITKADPLQDDSISSRKKGSKKRKMGRVGKTPLPRDDDDYDGERSSNKPDLSARPSEKKTKKTKSQIDKSRRRAFRRKSVDMSDRLDGESSVAEAEGGRGKATAERGRRSRLKTVHPKRK